MKKVIKKIRKVVADQQARLDEKWMGVAGNSPEEAKIEEEIAILHEFNVHLENVLRDY